MLDLLTDLGGELLSYFFVVLWEKVPGRLRRMLLWCGGLLLVGLLAGGEIGMVAAGNLTGAALLAAACVLLLALGVMAVYAKRRRDARDARILEQARACMQEKENRS